MCVFKPPQEVTVTSLLKTRNTIGFPGKNKENTEVLTSVRKNKSAMRFPCYQKSPRKKVLELRPKSGANLRVLFSLFISPVSFWVKGIEK